MTSGSRHHTWIVNGWSAFDSRSTGRKDSYWGKSGRSKHSFLSLSNPHSEPFDLLLPNDQNRRNQHANIGSMFRIDALGVWEVGMLKSRFALAILFMFSALSLSVAAQTVSHPEFKVLKPGPVIRTGPDNFQLTGSFSVSRGTEAQPIEERSFGSGGACIYADLSAVGAPKLACTSNSQCTEAINEFHEANLGNPRYDVASFSGSSGQCIANKCWYRPGARLCTRMIPPNSFALGHHKFGPFNLNHVAKFFGEDEKIEWQVVTCSNHAQPNGRDNAACAIGQGIYSPPLNEKATNWDAVVKYPNGD